MAETIHTVVETKSSFSLVDLTLDYDSVDDTYILSRAGVQFPLPLGTSLELNRLILLLAAAKTTLGV
jgi:hypothetical protein